MKLLALGFAFCAAALPLVASPKTVPAVLIPSSAAVFRVPVVPDATAPKVIIGFVAVGPAQRGVPCYSCVKGAQTTANIGLTQPFSYIATKEVAQYAMAFTDVSITASCKLSWSIAAGAKVLDSFTYTFKASAGSSYIYGFNRNRPAYSGAATVTGTVTCTGAAEVSTKAPLYFE